MTIIDMLYEIEYNMPKVTEQFVDLHHIIWFIWYNHNALYRTVPGRYMYTLYIKAYVTWWNVKLFSGMMENTPLTLDA